MNQYTNLEDAPMKNILFYKYVPLTNLNTLRKQLLDKAYELNIKGKILIAEEGINGCVSGLTKDVDQYKAFLGTFKEFSDIEFKEGAAKEHTFKRTLVKIRKEIITLGQEQVKLEHKAPYIEPQELKALLDKGEEIIIVDARNDYESKVGKFEGAIAPQIKVFSEWPQAVEELKEMKDKPIVTYCTGGIRCEKASAYMIEQGFSNVRQLHGGIVRYGVECGDDHWEGRCFVFDKRGAIEIDPKKQQLEKSQCIVCHLPCSDIHECNNPTCSNTAIICDECTVILEGNCSKRCRGMQHQRAEQQAQKQIHSA